MMRFKHQRVEVSFEFGRRIDGGPRPVTAPLKKPIQQVNEALKTEFKTALEGKPCVEGAPDDKLTRDQFVTSRLEKEKTGDPVKDQALKDRLEQAYDEVDKNHDGLDETEFLSLMKGQIEEGFKPDLGAKGAAGDVTAQQAQAVGQEITKRGPAIKAEQEEINHWIKTTPEGQQYAKSKGLDPNKGIQVDGLEGPQTRDAERAYESHKEGLSDSLNKRSIILIGAATPAQKTEDQKTLDAARAELAQLPPFDHRRKGAEAHVAALDKTFQAKYGGQTTPEPISLLKTSPTPFEGLM